MSKETDNRKPEAERRLAPVSLLDEFAMRFAPELIKRNTGCGTAWNHVAKDAYDAAEAMIEERRRRSSNMLLTEPQADNANAP